ncbi:MAG: GntR family transcriptional regulator [Acidobacteria bacterium]|nr:GntR family transcriptional regulator [Acidobacteriota bacterium]
MENNTILSVKSLKEQVYDYLRHQLSEGALRPGAAIHLDATCRKLGISKTPLREALIMLEMEDFVTIRPRRGVFVNELTLDDILDYYQLIGALESTALLAASPRLAPADIRHMADLNRWMNAALDDNDFDRYYRFNLEFHDTYIRASGNRRLIRAANTMKKRLYDFPRREGFVREWERSSVEEHRHIHELLAEGRPEEAARFVRDVHWSYSVQEKFILKYYASAARTVHTEEAE